jgi:hypothetical protein
MEQQTTEVTKTGLVTALEIPEGIVSNYRNKYAEYHITDINDPEAFKALKSAWQEVKNDRIAIDKRKKLVISQINELKKELTGIADPVIKGLKELEQELKTEMNRVEQEKKDAELAAKAAAEAKFAERTAQLFGFGFTFNGVNYVQGVFQMTPQEINDANDEEWELVLKAAEEGHQKLIEEQRKIDEALKLAEEAKKKAEEANAAPPEEKDVLIQPGAPVKEDDLPFGGEVVHTDGVDVTFSGTVQAGENVLQVNPGDRIPTIPDPNPIQPVTPENIADYRPEGYTLGFEACRTEIIRILEGKGKMKRSELIEKIKGLKP